MIRGGILAGILTLLIGGVAHAGTLTTPVVHNINGNRVSCVLTNVGTSTSAITSFQMFKLDGSEEVTINSCATTLAPHASCTIENGAAVASVYCTATATGKIRLSLNVLDISFNTITFAPGTK